MKKAIYTSVALLLAVFVVVSAIPATIPSVDAYSLSTRDDNWVKEYQEAKSKYITAHNEWEVARQHWLAQERKVEELRGLYGTDEFFKEAQEFELAALDVMETHNEIYIVWAENIEFQDENLRANVLDELYGHRESIEELRTNILNADSGDQLVEESKKVKAHWLEQRSSVKYVLGVLLSARANYILDRAEWTANEMQERLDEESDVRFTEDDRTYLQSIIDDYRENIELANQKYDSATERFDEVSNVRDGNRLVEDGHEFIKEGNRYVKTAHADLVEFVKEFKARSYPDQV